jgi:hypothetical protein
MKTILLGLVMVSAAMILSGCGSSASNGGDDPAGSGASSSNPPFSCDVHQIEFSDVQHRCATFASMPSDLRDDNCDATNGDQVVDSCPSDGLIGTCVVPNTNFESITYSYYSDSTLDVAEHNCAGLRGTFSAAK